MNIKPQSAILPVLMAGIYLAAISENADSAQPPATTTTSARADGSRIQFDSTVVDFGKIAGGQTVEHNYIFTNTGTEALEVFDVRPTCGCTITGKWDSHVEPGKTGHIPIRFTPPNLAGDVVKNVIVVCNDSTQTNVDLRIKGKVWEPIEIKPAFVVLSASEDCTSNITRSVKIVNNADQPLSLSEPKCTNAFFHTLLKTISPGKEFELQVTLKPPFKPEAATTSITLNTSSTYIPVVSVLGFATIRPLLTSMPAEIQLPPDPLREPIDTKIIIQNNGVAPLELSDAKSSVTDVAVQLRELEPGRRFEVTATFPVGFHLAGNQHVEIQFKTNHPRLPVFNVPVTQNQHLAALLNTSATGSSTSE